MRASWWSIGEALNSMIRRSTVALPSSARLQEDVSDLRESPSLDILELLRAAAARSATRPLRPTLEPGDSA